MSNILIIEDDPAVRENLEEILEFKGFRVFSTADGKEGLDMALKKEPDLIISDIMMPEMDGYQLLTRVREIPALTNTPVILLTAKNMIDSKIQGLEIGADDYVTKPFNSKELIVRIENLIKIRKKLKVKAYLNSNETIVEATEDIFMRELIEVFSTHMANSKFGIDDVVDEMGLSKSTLQRRVKAITRKTFNQFLREFRLEQAKQIIEQRGGNISEVAFASGFNSVSYFSFSFRNYFGFPPTEIQQQVGGFV